jgi:hypothetical protein
MEESQGGKKRGGGANASRKFDHKVGWRRGEAGRREEGREEADGERGSRWATNRQRQLTDDI